MSVARLSVPIGEVSNADQSTLVMSPHSPTGSSNNLEENKEDSIIAFFSRGKSRNNPDEENKEDPNIALFSRGKGRTISQLRQYYKAYKNSVNFVLINTSPNFRPNKEDIRDFYELEDFQRIFEIAKYKPLFTGYAQAVGVCFISVMLKEHGQQDNITKDTCDAVYDMFIQMENW